MTTKEHAINPCELITLERSHVGSGFFQQYEMVNFIYEGRTMIDLLWSVQQHPSAKEEKEQLCEVQKSHASLFMICCTICDLCYC